MSGGHQDQTPAKAGPSGPADQYHVQTASGYLHGWRLPSVSVQLQLPPVSHIASQN